MRTYPLRIPKLFHALMPSVQFRLSKASMEQYTLTFDDGPHPESTPLLLQLLDELNFKAQFFLLGKNAEDYPSLVKEIRSEGHLIGSHGYHHLNGWKTDTQDYVDNVQRACELLETRDFRPPYGKISWQQYEDLKKEVQIYLWTLMPGDYDLKVDAPTLLRRLLMHTRGRDIIVLHDQPAAFLKLKEVLPPLIEELRIKGLTHT